MRSSDGMSATPGTGLAVVFITLSIPEVPPAGLPRRLAHRHERNLLVTIIAGDTSCVWIEHRLAVHQEPVLMMAVAQLYLREPPTIHRPLHGQWMPMVEIADDLNRFGTGCGAIEVNLPV